MTHSELKPYQNKHVIITVTSGAKYLGYLYLYSQNTAILTNLCIINKYGTSTHSGANQKRKFPLHKIINIIEKNICV